MEEENKSFFKEDEELWNSLTSEEIKSFIESIDYVENHNKNVFRK